jgi:catechol 2,3-dioxygenase-like lactoylglutathione lyase family enzyme
MSSRVNHVSVSARDLEEGIAFYTELLGAERLATPAFGVPVAWLALETTQLHLFLSDAEPPFAHHFGITVVDLERPYRMAERLDAFERETFGNHLIELPGDVAQLYLRDPSGNLLELDYEGAGSLPEDIRAELRPLWDFRTQSEDNMSARLFLRP